MAKIYFSDFFDIPPDIVTDYGAFDVSLINDLPLFVDPFLLFNSADPKYRQLHDEIIRYMRFLKEVAMTGPVSPGLVSAWFTFPEVVQNWLGFSKKGNQGHGLGPDFARSLQQGLRTTFADFGEEILSRGSHLEKLCLIREGVGRDNISDFTVNLIQGFLALYTQEFAQCYLPPDRRRRVPIQKARFNYRTGSWVTEQFELPYFDNDFVLLTPRNILTKDDPWINRNDLLDRLVDIANSLPDNSLRAKLNRYLTQMLPDDPKATKKEIREVLVRAVEAFPAVLDYYVRDKEEHGDQATSTADARVREAEERFVGQVRLLVETLHVPGGFYSIAANTREEARQRLLFLKDVIENKGGHRLFYVDGKPLEREKDLHILYRLTWYATPSDVSREVDDGRGPADYKISRGSSDKTLVEFKLAKNTHLERNLEKQTAIYEKASDATHTSMKAILIFNETQQKRVDGILQRLGLTGSADIVLIDARLDNKPSGSKA